MEWFQWEKSKDWIRKYSVLSQTRGITIQGRIQDLPQERRANPLGERQYDCVKLSGKLHEIEKILFHRGWLSVFSFIFSVFRVNWQFGRGSERLIHLIEFNHVIRRKLLFDCFVTSRDTQILTSKTVADLRGCEGRPLPFRGPKFLHFHAVFGKIGQKIGWRSPPGLVHPSLGNPGSATSKKCYFVFMIKLDGGFRLGGGVQIFRGEVVAKTWSLFIMFIGCLDIQCSIDFFE